MNFGTTSRRDDMISIAYLLLVLLNGFKFPKASDLGFDPIVEIDNQNKVAMFRKLQELK